MKKIFIIKSTFVDKNKGFNNENVWNNLYGVATEEDAKKDCIRFQKEANEFYLGRTYKFVYIYEELDFWDN